jgi:hypothetical protein
MTSTSEKIGFLLNGPAKAGKDTAAKALAGVLGDRCEVFKITQPVKAHAHKLFGLDVAYDHYEVLKDIPQPEFGGLTPRQVYINTGNGLRAEFGEDITLRLFVETLARSTTPVVIHGDCGGDLEAEGVADHLGVDRVVVIRVHKEGHDFANDCRDWVSSDRLEVVDIVNVADRQDEFENAVVAVAAEFVSRYENRPGPAVARDALDDSAERDEMARITAAMADMERAAASQRVKRFA